jgi:hypothetical protein
MAYITQDDKKTINAALKVALKGHPTVKVSLSIQNNSSITATITQGPECLTPKSDSGYDTVNHYYIDTNYSGQSAEILKLINNCLHIGHWDKSDIQSDYFSCAWYVNIRIGRWDKAFKAV